MKDNPRPLSVTASLSLLSLLSAALLAWGLASAQPARGPEALLLLLGAVALELTAVRMPGFGFLSPALGAYLAAALLPGVGFGAA
ncbi:MAG: hypothetical protein AB1758_31100, partial [Candidatus Eremiobacterota bacterium]